MVATSGYEKYDLRYGILSIQHQSRVKFTNFAQDGLLFHIHKGRLNEEVLVRTSRNMSDYTFRKMPTKGMLDHLKMWNFLQIHPAPQDKYNLLEFVHQDENNNVSLKFGLPTKVEQKTIQELEEEFNTPTQCLFTKNRTAEQSYPRKSLEHFSSIKRPVIKLQRSSSSASLLESCDSHVQLNMMKVEAAESFEQLEAILRGEKMPLKPSKIEAQPLPQPEVMLNAISIDGDIEEDKPQNQIRFSKPLSILNHLTYFPKRIILLKEKHLWQKTP